MLTATETYFYSPKSCPVVGWEGLWDLYYFHTLAEAEAFGLSVGGIITETTKGDIWRISVRCK